MQPDDETDGSTPDTAPAPLEQSAAGPDPDEAGGGPDLSQLTDGRRGWVRVQDPGTGGQFDIRSDTVVHRLGDGLTLVANYPVHYGEQARLPKSRTDLAGAPVSPSAVSRSAAAGDDQAGADGAGVPVRRPRGAASRGGNR